MKTTIQRYCLVEKVMKSKVLIATTPPRLKSIIHKFKGDIKVHQLKMILCQNRIVLLWDSPIKLRRQELQPNPRRRKASLKHRRNRARWNSSCRHDLENVKIVLVVLHLQIKRRLIFKSRLKLLIVRIWKKTWGITNLIGYTNLWKWTLLEDSGQQRRYIRFF